MFMVKVTPVRNVLINERRYKSNKSEFFFNKVIDDQSLVQVYDVKERMHKLLNISEINAIKHRMVINDKRFFICSMTKCG
ncbi:MAG: hypothetical protein N2645_14815 [Clostridia bacterium]|nr:hypothetical protein [Clostridia bacterium]